MIPELLLMVILSPILNGRIIDRYNPDIMFARRFWEAIPTTRADIVLMDAATIGFCARKDIMAATIMIVPVILMRLLIALAVSSELPGKRSL
jgi:hypothetical protein